MLEPEAVRAVKTIQVAWTLRSPTVMTESASNAQQPTIAIATKHASKANVNPSAPLITPRNLTLMATGPETLAPMAMSTMASAKSILTAALDNAVTRLPPVALLPLTSPPSAAMGKTALLVPTVNCWSVNRTPIFAFQRLLATPPTTAAAWTISDATKLQPCAAPSQVNVPHPIP